MKKILVAMLFAVGVPAWASGVARVGDVPASPMDNSDCLRACGEQYADCLGGAGGAGDECDCYNGNVACERHCGVFRPFIRCP